MPLAPSFGTSASSDKRQSPHWQPPPAISTGAHQFPPPPPTTSGGGSSIIYNGFSTMNHTGTSRWARHLVRLNGASVVDPGCLSRIRIQQFFIPDTRSGSNNFCLYPGSYIKRGRKVQTTLFSCS
jgi:hypothetical protein